MTDKILDNGDIERTIVTIIPASQVKLNQDMRKRQRDILTAQIDAEEVIVQQSQAKVSVIQSKVAK